MTRNGRPAAVLVSPDNLESLGETLEILQDKNLLASIRKPRKESAAGKSLPLRDEMSRLVMPQMH